MPNSESPVLYESRDGIAVITLNRPERLNAVNTAVQNGLNAAWHRLNDSDDRVAILTHAGNDFSVGNDVKDPAADFAKAVPNVGVRLAKPLIAAPSGWVVGGSLCLVQMADLCVAADTAKFLYPEAKLGITGAVIAGVAARIPHKVAMELMLLGETVSAQRMYEVGFVNRVVPRAELMPTAMAFAERIRDNAPLVMQTFRRFVAELLPKGPSEYAAMVRMDLEQVRQSADAKEGVAAFKEKRKARFQGK